MNQVTEPERATADPRLDLSLGLTNENPRGIGLLALLREDLRVHRYLLSPGFWAVTVHRLGNWRMNVRSRLLRMPLSYAYYWAFYLVTLVAGIEIPYTIRLGRRVRIWHHGGIVLSAISIGDDVQIRQNTTMGIASIDRPWELPTIGDRVDIGCGAVILGAVTVGDDCKIGANAVVNRDIPPGSTAVGIPARVVRRAGDSS